MNTVEAICDVLGRVPVALRVGVNKTAVSNAVTQGKFPSKWYLVLSEMCREAGIECPTELFTFTPDLSPRSSDRERADDEDTLAEAS